MEKEPPNMPARQSSRTELALLGAAILCSLGSIYFLVTHPNSTSTWRTTLNIVGLLLVIAATMMVARRSRGRDA
jgi:hypothetical protein